MSLVPPTREIEGLETLFLFQIGRVKSVRPVLKKNRRKKGEHRSLVGGKKRKGHPKRAVARHWTGRGRNGQKEGKGEKKTISKKNKQQKMKG